VLGADREGIAEAQAVELARIDVMLWDVDLVDDEDEGLGRLAKLARQFSVHRSDALLSVHHEKDDLSGFDCNIHLGLYLAGKVEINTPADAACIDDREWIRSEGALGVNPIAGDAGHIVHDGDSAARETVEECALPDIRAAYDGDGTFRHGSMKLVRGLRIAVAARMQLADAFDDVAKAGHRGKKAREVDRDVDEVHGNCP